jgi:hypothetical protein
VPGIADGECRCGRGSQTARHVLLACPRHAQLRKELFNIEYGGPDGEGDLRKILNTPKLAISAARFMIHIRLLGQFEAVNRDEIT